MFYAKAKSWIALFQGLPLQIKIFWIILCIAFFLLFLFRIITIRYRYFTLDEWQHLHISWLIAQGKIPYIDFYEHHTPLFHYLIAPLLVWFPHSIAPLFLARAIVFVLALGYYAAFYWVIRLYHSRLIAWTSLLILSLTVMFSRKSVEIRPDALFLLLWLLAFGCITRGWLYKKRRWIGAAGLLLGLGFLTTPKALFLCMAIATVVVAGLWIKTDYPKKDLLLDSSLLLGMFFTPVLAYLIYFSCLHQDALQAFIQTNLTDNLTLNMHAQIERYWPTRLLVFIFYENPLLWPFAAIGIWHRAVFLRQSKDRKIVDVAPLIVTIVLFVSLFIMPRPNPHFYMILFPFISWHCAWVLHLLLEEIPRQPSKLVRQMVCTLLLFSGVVAPMLLIFQETGKWPYFKLSFPAFVYHTFGNQGQLDDLNWILENTLADEPVFTLEGHAFMRYDIDKFWRTFVIRIDDIPKALMDANCRVLMIDFNYRLPLEIRLPPQTEQFIRSNYRPVKQHFTIWVSGVNIPAAQAVTGKVKVHPPTTDLYQIESPDPGCRIVADEHNPPSLIESSNRCEVAAQDQPMQSMGDQILWLKRGNHFLRVKDCRSGFQLIASKRDSEVQRGRL